ncbi:MAG: NADPH-dependent assimilatory sulfite reductase hemoprotein subunit, partial [Verrucomicrobiota bacterium]
EIITTLNDKEKDHFTQDDYQLLKFHGTYQQDDRDKRMERRKSGLGKEWSFMVRTKMPAGRITAEQYLIHDQVAEKIGNGDLRLTTRQGIQLHGIFKGDLKECIHSIRESGMTTWGACGDIVRNTMGPASPIKDIAHDDATKIAYELNEVTMAKSSSYTKIWIEGEPVDFGDEEIVEEDPIYGKHYLPRKFKIGIAVPPRNDVDIYTQDLGLVPHVVEGKVEGYTLLVGGGFGMSHGKVQTHPILAQPLFYVKREHTVEACIAVITTQRDYGNREDRKQARLKYLIEKRGIEWFREEVASRINAPTEKAKELQWDTVADNLGWHEQGDGKLFCSVWVSQGRVIDKDGVNVRTAIRTICEKFDLPIIITPNTNIIFHDIDPVQKDEIDAILQENGMKTENELTQARQMSHACVSLPTCGLGLAESERAFGPLMDRIDDIIRELKLDNEHILFRMTGCPNGCARPYNADFSFVGRAPKKYAFYVGGSSCGHRLGGLQEKTITYDEIPEKIRPYLEEFANNKENGETFTHYWGRTHTNGPAPSPEQFHVEFAEREAANAVA